jgi:hypothetical protein
MFDKKAYLGLSHPCRYHIVTVRVDSLNIQTVQAHLMRFFYAYRFMVGVILGADENHANYLPLNERKVTYFQFILEDEFKQEVNINQLRTFAKSHGLKCYLMTRVGA